MARIYGTMGSVSTQGRRVYKEVGRGSRGNMKCHVRGWDTGVKVEVTIDPVSGCETFTVYRTGGTNNPTREIELASFTDIKSGGPRDRKGRLK